MILSAILLVSLLAASASASAIKGRGEEYAVKGVRQLVAPVEYQRQHYEQRDASYAAKGAGETHAPEQAKLADSELYQQREETKSERQQFYEAQPQLRDTEYKSDLSRKPAQATRSEERVEEQRLVQSPEQTKIEDIPQQREEPVAQIKQEVKGVTRQEVSQVKVQQREETKQAAYEKQQNYEARPQVREEAAQVLVAVAPAPAKSAAKAEQVYSKTEERREEQVQYTAQAPAEQTKLEEVQQRLEEAKGQKYEAQRDEFKSSAKATVQRVEEPKFEQERQPELFQQVDLTKQDYEQRHFEEQTEQRVAEEQIAQAREEGALKGGLRPAGAEAEPYAFDYSVEGSSRRESGDQHGVVRGQYTIQNVDGSQRIVDYVADRDGFRAQVQTNEFGTESQQPANVVLRSSQPTAETVSLRLEGKTREAAVAAGASQYPAAVKSAQPFVQVAEVSRSKLYDESQAGGYKGAPVVTAPAPAPAAAKGAEQHLEVKAPLVVAHEPAPYKGQRTEEATAHLYQQRPVEPIKSAELKAPKASPGQLKTNAVVTRASGFESATAHRPVVHAHPVPVSTVVRHVQTVPVAAVHHQVVAPARNHHYHQRVQPVPVGGVGVSRSQLRHDRYPPASYSREQPLNPRVSFYANSFEDEQPAGFEHSADLI